MSEDLIGALERAEGGSYEPRGSLYSQPSLRRAEWAIAAWSALEQISARPDPSRALRLVGALVASDGSSEAPNELGMVFEDEQLYPQPSSQTTLALARQRKLILAALTYHSTPTADSRERLLQVLRYEATVAELEGQSVREKIELVSEEISGSAEALSRVFDVKPTTLRRWAKDNKLPEYNKKYLAAASEFCLRTERELGWSSAQRESWLCEPRSFAGETQPQSARERINSARWVDWDEVFELAGLHTAFTNRIV